MRERQAAKRAQDAAQRARLHAVGWLELLRELDERERRADERDRKADERERIADERERAADELEARLYDDRPLRSSGAPHRSDGALREVDVVLAYARARVKRLAAERQAQEKSQSAETD
ncbi:MAG TPA: hypothetical protein VEF89_05825 [Solirubrobacteraceae bacterium]|nr:hypothetical protein [Solirubrobacteraceae bacterium]